MPGSGYGIQSFLTLQGAKKDAKKDSKAPAKQPKKKEGGGGGKAKKKKWSKGKTRDKLNNLVLFQHTNSTRRQLLAKGWR